MIAAGNNVDGLREVADLLGTEVGKLRGETVVHHGYGCPYLRGQALRDELGDDNAIVQVWRAPRPADAIENPRAWVAFGADGRVAYSVVLGG